MIDTVLYPQLVHGGRMLLCSEVMMPVQKSRQHTMLHRPEAASNSSNEQMYIQQLHGVCATSTTGLIEVHWGVSAQEYDCVCSLAFFCLNLLSTRL